MAKDEKRFIMHADEKLPGFRNPRPAIRNIHPDHNAGPISVIKVGRKGKTINMKITYLSLIAALSTGLVGSAQPVMAQRGQHHSGQQFNQHAQRQRERERSRTSDTTKEREREREREREKPNGVMEEQRQEQRTNAAGQTQTIADLVSGPAAGTRHE